MHIAILPVLVQVMINVAWSDLDFQLRFEIMQCEQ